MSIFVLQNNEQQHGASPHIKYRLNVLYVSHSDMHIYMEGYLCQKSTLCNKRSNKKECGINKKEHGILQPLA